MTQLKQQYEKKPIESWARMKELRRWRFKNNWEAQKKGNLAILSEAMGLKALWAGFGSPYYAVMSVSPYWTGAKRNPDEIRRLLEFTDSKGYGPQVCGALRLHLAHLLEGKTTVSPTGENVTPDFAWQLNFCPQVSRLVHEAANKIGIPYIWIEPLQGGNVEKSREYIVEQLYGVIDQVKKVTKREYDPELLIEATKNELTTYKLFATICMLNQSIPAPLCARDLISLTLIKTVMAHTKESVEFYKGLLAEVEDRVKNKITSTGYETARLYMDAFPWPFPKALKYPETYGATVVAGDHPFLDAQIEELDDGKLVVRRGFDEQINSIKDMDSALKALAWMWEGGLKVNRHSLHNWHIDETAGLPIKMAEQWHCDGMVLAAMKDCFQQMCFGTETKLLADKKGIPNMLFYSILTDIRQFDPDVLQKQFDDFLSKDLGLTKFEDRKNEGLTGDTGDD
jgi:benzoyl-CoA reductase/2-hydroxyglutaryl-CoA dehydratase subunit BcrC/BadD/HgdB